MSAKHTPAAPTPTAAANAFREELKKIMPGYVWRIEKPRSAGYLEGWGIQSSGSNRLSTLYVLRIANDRGVSYEAKSAGYGTRARWLHTCRDGTLARALRGLQDHYESVARTYRVHASDLANGRIAKATGSAS